PPAVEAASPFLARWVLCENSTSNSILPLPILRFSGFVPKGSFFAWQTTQYCVERFRNSAAWQVSFEHGLCPWPGNLRRPFGFVSAWQPLHSLIASPALFAWRVCSKSGTWTVAV